MDKWDTSLLPQLKSMLMCLQHKLATVWRPDRCRPYQSLWLQVTWCAGTYGDPDSNQSLFDKEAAVDSDCNPVVCSQQVILQVLPLWHPGCKKVFSLRYSGPVGIWSTFSMASFLTCLRRWLRTLPTLWSLEVFRTTAVVGCQYILDIKYLYYFFPLRLHEG